MESQLTFSDSTFHIAGEFVPNARQRSILSGKLCPYCNRNTVITRNIFGARYVCPSCGAYVGCHKGTVIALGRVADKNLRQAKIRAHEAFDKLWKSNFMTRTQAYAWLAEATGIPGEFAHIGMFSIRTCIKVVMLCEDKLRRMK